MSTVRSSQVLAAATGAAHSPAPALRWHARRPLPTSCLPGAPTWVVSRCGSDPVRRRDHARACTSRGLPVQHVRVDGDERPFLVLRGLGSPPGRRCRNLGPRQCHARVKTRAGAAVAYQRAGPWRCPQRSARKRSPRTGSKWRRFLVTRLRPCWRADDAMRASSMRSPLSRLVCPARCATARSTGSSRKGRAASCGRIAGTVVGIR